MSVRNLIPASRLFIVSSRGTTAADKIFDADSPRCEVILVWAIMNAAGAATDKVKLDDGTSDITDDVDVSAKGDTDLFLVGEIDDAKSLLAKGSTLTVTRTSAAPVDVFILCALLEE